MSLADLTTEEIAMFQLLEQGYSGITNGVSLIRAEDANYEEASRLIEIIKAEQEKGIFPGFYDDLITLLNRIQQRTAVLVVYKPAIEVGQFNVEPIARLLFDPSEVVNPQFEHTDGEGNEREGEARGDDHSGGNNGNSSNSPNH